MDKKESIIILENVHKYFGQVHAVDGVDLEVGFGEVVVVIGPSGSGKSTMLRCINQLEPIDDGRIIIDSETLNEAKNINKIRAEIGMVFQSFNLFPHLTALENIILAQRIVRKRKREEAKKMAREQLQHVGIPEKADS